MDLRVFRIRSSTRQLEESNPSDFEESVSHTESQWWIDVTRPDTQGLTRLAGPLRLHPLVTDACLDPQTGPRITVFAEAVFIQLRLKTSWNELTSTPLSIVCLPHVLVTSHVESIAVLDDVAADFAQAVAFHSSETASILYGLLDRLVTESAGFAVEGRRDAEGLEVALDEDHGADLVGGVLALKRRTAHLEITLEEFHRVFSTLLSLESVTLPMERMRHYYRDAVADLDHTLRVVQRIGIHVSELHQFHLLALQEKVNRRLHLLTVISAMFLPLSLIAGIYGMNFRRMPELEWRYGYAFALALMLVVAGSMAWSLYRRGWFR